MNRLLYLFLIFSPLLSFAQGQQWRPLSANGYLVRLELNASLESWVKGHQLPGQAFFVEKIVSAEYKILLLQHRSGHTENSLLTELAQQAGIQNAQLNHSVQLRNTTPNDPFWEAQWNLQQIGALSMWTASYFGQTAAGIPIVLGILEPTGFDTKHEDLQSQIWINEAEIPFDGLDNEFNGYVDDYMGWNALQQNDEHYSTDPHGTMVAGISSAASNNERGVTGIGWNSKLLLLSGNRYESEVIANYIYALELRKRFNESEGQAGAFVVATNASFGISGHPNDFPIWCELYNDLGAQGILSVSAADNRPVNTDLRADMPTSCKSEYLIPVTGVDEFDHFLSGKAYGPETVDIAAPAVGLMTTAPNNRYVEVLSAGNSYAAPQVTGAIGLMYSLPYAQIQELAIQDPSNMALLMKSFLLDGVQKLPTLKDKIKSEGRLDLEQTHRLIHQYFNQEPIKLKIHQVYPNPFDAQIQIDCHLPETGTYQLKVVDLRGRVVAQKVFNATILGQQMISFQLEHVAIGMYLLQIEGTTAVTTHKMIKIVP
jgi:hypothetical protein